jgi:hypothetical protein
MTADATPVAVIFRGGDHAAASGIEFGELELVFSDGSREVRGWVPHIAAVAVARELAVPVTVEELRSSVGTQS